ncbi:MAG: hypothetical protein KDD34_01720 [Bdellovibrionales bacterium]|nr:hypothetical protein [Bdellovibrionales bacterium]
MRRLLILLIPISLWATQLHGFYHNPLLEKNPHECSICETLAHTTIDTVHEFIFSPVSFLPFFNDIFSDQAYVSTLRTPLIARGPPRVS